MLTMTSHDKGFTLIEIMSALAIMAIAFVVLIGLRNRDFALSEQAAYITQATLLARQKISEMTLETDKENTPRNGDFGESYPDYKWEVEVNETEFASLRELVVRVSWKNENRDENLQLVKYFFLKKT